MEEEELSEFDAVMQPTSCLLLLYITQYYPCVH